jgi:hypothetical protein
MDNRPGLIIVQVLRRLTLGSTQAMLPLAGVTSALVELTLYNGRWLWRDVAANGNWRPLRLGDRLPLAGAELTVTAGTYTVFQE